MASRRFMLDGDLPVSVYKRRNSRNIRLTVSAEGQVKVSIPSWAPYRAAVDFAKSKREWILSQQRSERLLVEGQSIGKAHHLYFRTRATATVPVSRVAAGAVIVSHPPHLETSHSEVQKAAREGGIRALKTQAEQLLPQRLDALAEKHGFNYSDVKIKRLRSRWGSCDHNGVIALSLFLMQLPWDCIDYVLLHELTHTRVMRHGPDFWTAMTDILPEAKAMRKRLRAWQPALDSPPLSDVA